MWKPIICLAMLCFLITGCNLAQNKNKAENENNEVKYQHLSTQSNNQRVKDLSGQQTQTIGTEINTAKRIMRSYNQYKLVSVSINGNNMWVTAHTRNQLSAHERMQREADIHDKLEKALPQYKINVKLEEK